MFFLVIESCSSSATDFRMVPHTTGAGGGGVPMCSRASIVRASALLKIDFSLDFDDFIIKTIKIEVGAEFSPPILGVRRFAM